MKVLVVDNSPDIVETISLCFQMRWPQTTIVSVSDGTAGILLAEKQNPDVVILDVDLPDMNGLEVCREIRRFSDVPIIMLGAGATDTEASRALETGADAYIAKPFNHIELVWRVQAVIRRAQRLPLSKREGAFSCGALTIDYDVREVLVNGAYVKLTPIEYGLLYYLTHNAGRVQTHKALLSNVWGKEYQQDRRLLASHIHNLRRKLGDNPQNPKMIFNERCVGYKFAKVS